MLYRFARSPLFYKMANHMILQLATNILVNIKSLSRLYIILFSQNTFNVSLSLFCYTCTTFQLVCIRGKLYKNEYDDFCFSTNNVLHVDSQCHSTILL